MEYIELIKDENRDDILSEIRVCCPNNDLHELAVLKEKLEAVGVGFRVGKTKNGSNMLVFDFEDVNCKVNRTRNAGRKPEKMDEKYNDCTVYGLKEMLKTMKKVDIIKELGCPKSTFYRVLKNIEAKNIDIYGPLDVDLECDRNSIWEYTN